MMDQAVIDKVCKRYGISGETDEEKLLFICRILARAEEKGYDLSSLKRGAKCNCKTPVNFAGVGLVKHQGEARILVQCPYCGRDGLLKKDKVKPGDIEWCKNPGTVAWIGI
jgi:hypothetical protein